MTGENGTVPVSLYVRVSTDEQAAAGYSVEGQREELRAQLAREGREVVAEVVDPGEKRWSLDRPGIGRLRELAASGQIAEVWAWRWDRFGESPWPEVLAIEFEGHGVALRSLDDGGEGEDAEILRALRSAMAKKERKRTTERTRMGKFAKARRGEIGGSAFAPRYGFSYVRNDRGKAVAYAVDPEKMDHVRRIFSMLAGGESIHAVHRELEQGGVAAPGGGRRWSRTTIKNVAQEDAYLPRTVEELEGTVPTDVLAGLDPAKRYGVCWFGRRRSRYTGKGKTRKAELQPRETWVAVPVDLTGSGLERGTVELARAAVVGNRSPSKAGGRFWELSGGVLRCADCGRAMITYRRKAHSDSPLYGPYLHYYRCRPDSTFDLCANRRSHRAENVEYDAVWLFENHADGGMLLDLYDEAVEERKRLEGPNGDPGKRAALVERSNQLNLEREGYLRQNARGVLSDAGLDAMLAEVDGQRGAVAAELRAEENRGATARRIEAARESLSRAAWCDRADSWYDPVHSQWYEDPDAVQPGEYLSLGGASPGEAHRAYRRFGARFEIDAEGAVTMRLDVPLDGGTLHLTTTR